MRIEVEVTYYCRGRAKDKKGGMSYMDGVAKVPFEVREATVTDAPAVVRYGTEAGPVEIRGFEGRLLRRVSRDRMDGDDLSWLARECRHGRYRTVFGGGIGGAFAYEDDPKFTLRNDGSRAEAIAKAADKVAGMVILDGEVWRETPEPVYHVARHRGPDGDTFSVAVETYEGENCFRLDQADVLRRFVRATFPDSDGDVELPAVETLDASALKGDPQSGALVGAAVALVSVLRETVASSPMSTMVTYARVRDLSKGHPDPAGEGEGTGKVLRRLLPELTASNPDMVPDYTRTKLSDAFLGWDLAREDAALRESSTEEDEALSFAAPFGR